jgi:signal transduction histidine kinase
MKYSLFIILIFAGCRFAVNAQTTAQLLDSARHYKHSDFERAIRFSGEAYKKAIAARQYSEAGASAAILGAGNYLASRFDDAIKWYFESERIYSGIKDTAGLSELYADMCIFYIKVSKFKDAEKIIRKSVAYAAIVNDTTKLATAINNRGLIYLDESMPDSALADFQTSYRLYKSKNDKTGMAYSQDYISSALSEKKMYGPAIEAMNESRKLREGTGDNTGLAIAINNIGELYMKLNEPAKAIPYFNDAIIMAVSINYTDLQSYGFDQLAKAYFMQGRYEEAYEAQSKYMELNQKVQDEKRAKNLQELVTKYKTNEKEQENKILQEENLTKQARLDKNRIVLYALTAVAITTILLLYLIYARYRLAQQARFKQAMLEEQKLRSLGIMDAEENERRRLARELHDGVGQLLSATRRKIQFLQANEGADVMSEPLRMLDESIKEVRDLSHSMMPPSLLNKDLRQAIQEFISRINSNKELEIQTEWVNTDNLKLDKTTTLMLYRSVQEIIGNALKHANASTINIEMVNHDTEVTLVIYDDGIGFDKFEKQDTNTGLGLSNIQSRIAYIGGTLEINSAPGRGVTYVIEVPVLNQNTI